MLSHNSHIQLNDVISYENISVFNTKCVDMKRLVVFIFHFIVRPNNCTGRKHSLRENKNSEPAASAWETFKLSFSAHMLLPIHTIYLKFIFGHAIVSLFTFCE